jgi:hypothetical protein
MNFFEDYFLLGISALIVMWGGRVIYEIFHTNRPTRTASGEEL